MPDGSPEGVDLLEAIAMAGGYTRIAAPERITVKRANEVVKVNGKRLAHGWIAGIDLQLQEVHTRRARVRERVFQVFVPLSVGPDLENEARHDPIAHGRAHG